MGINATSHSIFHKTSLPVLGKSLDAGMLRSKAISNNIANVNTPKYNRVEVKFEDDLKKALDRTSLKGAKTDQRHMDVGRLNLDKVQPKTYRPIDPALASAVNNVDIDMEAAKMAENQILFNYGVRFMQHRLGAVFSAIKGVVQKL